MSTKRKPQHRRRRPAPPPPSTRPTSSTTHTQRSRNLTISLALVVAAVAVAVLLASRSRQTDEAVAAAAGDGPAQLVRLDSRRLNNVPDGRPVFVEFIDYECESCRAAQPFVEDLLDRYGDRVSFVVRAMPLHANSVAAARAAEAAGAQDRYTDMVTALFRTQPEWGEQRSSQEETFFGLAEELGLDMERFRRDYDDPAVVERIERDRRDGERLGVRGTPTFFLDGEQLQIETVDDLVVRFEAALAG